MLWESREDKVIRDKKVPKFEQFGTEDFVLLSFYEREKAMVEDMLKHLSLVKVKREGYVAVADPEISISGFGKFVNEEWTHLPTREGADVVLIRTMFTVAKASS